MHSRGDAQSGDCHSALEFLGGDLAKAERSGRAARQAPLPLAGYPLFYLVLALMLQGEVDESEAALEGTRRRLDLAYALGRARRFAAARGSQR